jgi:hypothetical protein
LAYFLTARFSVRLILEPSGVAVFWPAAGISSGLLIALGPRARWPVLAGVVVATIATHLIINDLSLPKIKSVRIDGAALQERASLGCARCVE